MNSCEKEVIYAPLSLNGNYKVRLNDLLCEVKSEDDQYLISLIEFKDSTAIVNFRSSNADKVSPLLLVQLEYILGHFCDYREIELTGFNGLEYPFEILGTTFSRTCFFQIPALWHHRLSYSITPEVWTESNGRHHPVRTKSHTGRVYKRYVPEIQKSVSFRRIELNDLDTFSEWHNQPRVSFFWELNKTKDELKSYIQKGLEDPHQIPMIVEIDQEAAGYFEMYWVREDRLGPYYESEAYDRGFHFLIGNKKFLGRVTTDAIIKSCLHFLYLDDARTRRIMAEPRHDNQKVLKYAEASKGWRKVKVFDFPHKRAVLLENSRENFFGGNSL